MERQNLPAVLYLARRLGADSGVGNLQGKVGRTVFRPNLTVIVAVILPTVYVAVSYYWGLNAAIANWATQGGIHGQTPCLSRWNTLPSPPCSASCLLSLGFKGLKSFSVPVFFLILVGVLYTIDNVFPYGQFTPFQIFVPTTTAFASAILNLMGYTTSITYGQNGSDGANMPFLT